MTMGYVETGGVVAKIPRMTQMDSGEMAYRMVGGKATPMAAIALAAGPTALVLTVNSLPCVMIVTSVISLIPRIISAHSRFL